MKYNNRGLYQMMAAVVLTLNLNIFIWSSHPSPSLGAIDSLKDFIVFTFWLRQFSLRGLSQSRKWPPPSGEDLKSINKTKSDENPGKYSNSTIHHFQDRRTSQIFLLRDE
jgi:hypothetical protein